MTETILYAAPGTCARVPTIVLEETGMPFETRVIRFMRGEHKSPEYKALNPTGKLPALIIDGHTLSENVAIINYLNETRPEAGIMPEAATAYDRAVQTADLCFCSSTLHPLVTRIRMPQLFAGPENMRSVWTAGCEAMKEYFGLVEARLATGPWWYGDIWSTMDAYIYWVFWRVNGAGFPTDQFPRFSDHAVRMEARPAVQRAIAREDDMTKQLAAEGLVFTPPPLPPS